LKKLGISGLAVTALLAMGGTALAQTPPADLAVTVNGKASPSKAGTKKKPKNVSVKIAFEANKESRKTVSQIVFYLPKNLKLSGSGFKTCTAQQINGQGEASCPKGSKVGSGTATAVLGVNQTPLQFTNNVYVGGKNSIALALKGTVDIAFEGTITKASGAYSQKLTVDIPPQVQSPAPGLFSYITGVDTTIKGSASKGKGKKKKKYAFASVNGCPKDKTHDFGVQLNYVANDAGAAGSSEIFTGTSPCKK